MQRNAYPLASALVLTATLAVAHPAHATGRTLRVSPFPVRYIFTDYYNGAVGTPCPGDAQIGGMLSYTLTLTNVGGNSQQVTVTIGPGSTGVISEVGCGLWSNLQYGQCVPSASPAVSSNSNSLSGLGPATFRIDPGASMSYILAGFGLSKMANSSGCSSSTDHHSTGDFNLNVAFQITVNEDRGALIGTLVPQIDGPVPGMTACGGINIPNVPTCGLSMSYLRTTVPLLVNGGRPF